MIWSITDHGLIAVRIVPHGHEFSRLGLWRTLSRNRTCDHGLKRTLVRGIDEQPDSLFKPGIFTARPTVTPSPDFQDLRRRPFSIGADRIPPLEAETVGFVLRRSAPQGHEISNCENNGDAEKHDDEPVRRDA